MDDFRRRNLIEKDEFTSSSNPKSEKKGKSLVEALLGDSENFKLVAERFNLDPEMSEKIVVPLLSLVDKYGIGESITSSPQLESASNTMEIIRDVAPVVRGAAEFISGRRAELESDDLAFLEEIKKSQSVSDASLFNSEEDDELFTIGESVILLLLNRNNHNKILTHFKKMIGETFGLMQQEQTSKNHF